MDNYFPHLFSPVELGKLTVKNRIVSTGHDTTIPTAGVPDDRLIAYHQARAEGGAGLIVIQVAAVHPTAHYTSHVLTATSDECIPGYRRLAHSLHHHDCTVFGQLFHPGREVIDLVEGAATVAYAPSAVPSERFHVFPRPLPRVLITEIVDGYGEAALRMKKAGLDGVEIVASHGYLPAQFLNPRVNLRDDDYGGSPGNRLRFLHQVIGAIRDRVGDMVVGMRISGNEKDPQGLQEAEALDACAALDSGGGLDYFNVIAGSSASLSGAIHIVPPMAVSTGYVAPCAATMKQRVSVPVIVGGRINQPQIAEQILASGQADLCGMTRAMICDPQMPNKARAGHMENIRACIACNQACIGHFHLGFPISCIQHPETGRELRFGKREPAAVLKRVLVAGGGPGGMKAAAVAAERGHRVTLYEAAPRLGGQALLAQLLPGRAEFGGIVTNLSRELERAGVCVVLNTPVTADLVAAESPDALIIATGARPRLPVLDGAEEAHVVGAWQVLGGANVGHSVVVADWRADWIGLGLAEKLARDGCHVRLYVNGYIAGETIHRYVRDEKLGVLHKLGVEITPMVRLFGVDADTVYFQHLTSDEAILAEHADTLVLAQGHESVDALARSLSAYSGEVIMVGDCLAPRSAEEAVLEGLHAGSAL